MITYLPFPPLTVILGHWEFPIDPYNSTRRRILRDKKRQVRVSVEGKETYSVEIQARDIEEKEIFIKDNLWRIITDHSNWRNCLQLQLTEGFNKFVSQGMEFIAEIVPVTKTQVKIGIYYNEPRNVSAAEIGYNLHRISAVENWDNTAY